MDKHFKHNILHKIFNRKALKIRYSCMKNIFQIINNHNKEIRNFITEQIIIIIIIIMNKKICKIVVFVVPADHRINLNKSEKKVSRPC